MANFGEAIEHLKNGGLAARENWNGVGMSIHLEKGISNDFTKEFIGGVNQLLFDVGPEGIVTRFPNLNMITPSKAIVTGWLASQTDILAEDWKLL